VSEEAKTRREFCADATRAGASAAFAAALASLTHGCGGGGSPSAPSSAPPLPTVIATLAGGTLSVTVDAGSPLAGVGGAALVVSAAGRFLAAHIAQDTFVALTAVCTHEACVITGFAGGRYVCPCHGSNFDTSGQVLQGPATRALRQYATSFAGGVLTITL
jgi:cytochrome b6-f complex iron-sulfur subunit